MADRHNRDLDRKPGQLPEPIKTKTVDSHAHLELIHNSEPDSPLIKQTLDQAASVGIDRVVQVGYSAEQSIWSVKCAESFVGQVLAAVALHPNEAPVVDDLEKDLNIANDDFIRTTEDRHSIRVQKFLQSLKDAGHIYAGKFEGPYCIGCEEFKLPGDLDEGKCKIHSKPVEMLSEDCAPSDCQSFSVTSGITG